MGLVDCLMVVFDSIDLANKFSGVSTNSYMAIAANTYEFPTYMYRAVIVVDEVSYFCLLWRILRHQVVSN